ncbi:hypothetical protein D8B24_21250, partial [Verminephrobacter aporrectodeae subsp. tuberculatae]
MTEKNTDTETSPPVATASTPDATPTAPQTSAQQDPAADSLTALCMVARLHQTAADPATLAHQIGLRP